MLAEVFVAAQGEADDATLLLNEVAVVAHFGDGDTGLGGVDGFFGKGDVAAGIALKILGQGGNESAFQDAHGVSKYCCDGRGVDGRVVWPSGARRAHDRL